MGTIDNSTRLTIMAIRESLMRYFKGTCVEDMTQSANVRLRKDWTTQGTSHQYERLALEANNKCVLYCGDLKLFTVSSAPKKIVFYSCLDRSPQLREVKKEIAEFMHDFLGAVDVSYIHKDVTETDDSGLMKLTILRDKEQEQAYQEMAYIRPRPINAEWYAHAATEYLRISEDVEF